jgi:hypothetical protein
MPLLVRRLEGLYKQMMTDLEAGQLPRPDLLNLPEYLEVGSEVHHEELEVQTLKGYHAWWSEMLARRHAFRPLEPDRRLGRLSSPT